jgi:L-iditol 2-dehydrogenase
MQLRRIEKARGCFAAVACSGGDRTVLEQRETPVPGPGELLLALDVVGFCGTDLFKLKTGSAVPGSVLGHELVGTVCERGEGVAKFREGDRIVVPHHVACGECHLCRQDNPTMCVAFKENLLEPGGFSDRILIRRRAVEQAARKIPDYLSDERAVFMEPAACVLRGVRRSGVTARGAAVVLGAGSMGLLHLLVLRAVFPDLSVVMIDLDEGRLELAERLGAAAVAVPGEAARDAAHAVSSGLGADAVFDTVGGSKALNAGLALTRPGGTVVLFAHAPEGEPAGLDLNTLFKRERRIVATYSGALEEQAAVFDLLCDGSLDPSPLVTHKMPLDDFSKGVELIVQRRALKVLFTPSREASA